MTMKKENRKYKLSKEWLPGNYGPSIVLNYRGKSCPLQCGLSDYLSVLRDGDNFAVLSVNRRIGYVGIEIIDSQEMEVIGDFFEPHPDEKMLEMSENMIADVLIDYIY